jgi:hypothetical protein
MENLKSFMKSGTHGDLWKDFQSHFPPQRMMRGPEGKARQTRTFCFKGCLISRRRIGNADFPPKVAQNSARLSAKSNRWAFCVPLRHLRSGPELWEDLEQRNSQWDGFYGLVLFFMTTADT